MDKRLTRRLIALILSGGILISSTGVYTALAASEEYTTSEYTSELVGSDETVTDATETTVPSTSESTTSGTTEAETTEKETEAESTTVLADKPATITPSTTEKEETTVKDVTTTLPPFVGEEEEETIAVVPENNEAITTGDGSESNPYIIATADDLLEMNSKIKETSQNKYFKLSADIDLSSVTSTDFNNEYGLPGSLISVNPELSGYTRDNHFFHLDGDGHKIYGLSLTDSTYDALTIFGYLNSNCSIENVVFDNIAITNENTYAQATGIILKNEGSVKNCQFTNITLTMLRTQATDDSFLANDSLRVYSGVGCVVNNAGTIDNTAQFDSSTSDITASSITVNTVGSDAGALVAYNTGKINKVRVSDVTVTGDTCVGGLVGSNMTQRTATASGIQYCEVSDSKVTGNDKLGYIVGYNEGPVFYSTAIGKFKSNVQATADNYDILIPGNATAGGIAGEDVGNIQNCNATDIGVYFSDETDGATYGGITGESTYGIVRCIATGSTAGAGTDYNIERYIGGIVGYGSTSSSFKVVNCYTLVKLINSKVPLGAVIGYNGDEAYKNDRIEKAYYSSIISTRPSPVSYGVTGENDLVFSKPYAIVNCKSDTNNNVIEADTSDFSFSGWGTSTSFSVEGNFNDNGTTPEYASFTEGTKSMKYTLVRTGDGTGALINYDVDITLPTVVGSSTQGTTLDNEPMEFGILNLAANTVEDIGSGTKDDPFVLTAAKDFNLLYYAPAAHFIVSGDITLNTTTYTAPAPATFWGSVDFNNTTLTFNVDKPLFSGIYGTIDAKNSTNGVIKNLTVSLRGNTSASGTGIIGYPRYISSLFGNLCNANVSGINVTFTETSTSIVPTESETGLFAKGVYGNTYMYGCYVESNHTYTTEDNITEVTTNTRIETEYDSVSGFIGVIDAENAVIDNCGSDMVVFSNGTNLQNLAVFVSKIKALNGTDGGEISNCYATGGVVNKSTTSYDNKTCNIFAGVIEEDSSEVVLTNCYYSPSALYSGDTSIKGGTANGIKAGTFTGSCKLWSFQKSTDVAGVYKDTSLEILSKNGGSISYLNVENLNNFSKYDISDATSGFVYNSASDPASTDDRTITFNITGLTVYGSIIGINTDTFNDTAPDDSESASVTLYLRHIKTGLVARLVVRCGLAFGTEKDAEGNTWYVITTAEQLYTLSENQDSNEYVINQETGEYEYTYHYKEKGTRIKLGADIDMAGLTIKSIGNSSHPFKGIFDGQGYTISNLTIDRGVSATTGLFGYVMSEDDDNPATIKNLTLDNLNIANAEKENNSGGLIANVQDYAVIEDCHIIDSSVTGLKSVGAIVGAVMQKNTAVVSPTTITGCTVEGTTVKSTAENDQSYIGAIVGNVGSNTTSERYVNITNCEVIDSTVTAEGYGIGGIVGYAANINNTISGCQVTGSEIVAENSYDNTKASLAGVAAIYGGSIENTDVINTKVTGECASGVVGRIINAVGTTATISGCTVQGCTITSPDIAGGIVATINGYEGQPYNGKKVIDNCKITGYTPEDSETTTPTTVKALVSGGIVGAVFNNFSSAELSITNSTNLGVIETTGRKGSTEDAAGGIIGRLGILLDTSGIQISNCLSQGEIKGNSNLGGIIGMNSALAHSSESKLITNSYVTTAFTSKNLAVVKGLAIGYMINSTANAGGSPETLVSNLYYSSLNNKEPLFGNNTDTTGGVDANKGANGTSGLRVDLTTTSIANTTQKTKVYVYTLNAVVGYEDGSLPTSTNVIELKPNLYIGSTEFAEYSTSRTYTYATTDYKTTITRYTAVFQPRFSVTNTPEIPDADGTLFAVQETEDGVFDTSINEAGKILIGCSNATGSKSTTYNMLTDVSIQTWDKKCEAIVKTTYAGTVNGETVAFDVGFTVKVKTDHKFEGSGTSDDPFKIYTADDLLSIKQHHDNPASNTSYVDPYYDNPDFYYSSEAHYVVMNDIDLSEVLTDGKSFAPIGTSDEPFMGTIASYNTDEDGNIQYTEGDNQYKITGLIIDQPALATDYAYSTDYGESAEYSDALGLFGYTDGASISNLVLENVTIASVANTSNGYLGASTGSLIGVAENTEVNNVEVTGAVNIEITSASTSTVGGLVGKALSGVVLKDVSLIANEDESGSEENLSSIRALAYVGGIVGSTDLYATGCSIINPTVENVKVTNTASSGSAVAGGIAGMYTGKIAGADGSVKVNNTIVEGIVAGGVVGSGTTNPDNQNDGILYDLTIESAVVTNTDIRVFEEEGSTFSDDVKPNTIAGGILGLSTSKFSKYITDCTVDESVTVSTYYCAGGIVGKAENTSGNTGAAKLIISGCSSMTQVAQTDTTISESSTYMRRAGASAVIGVVAESAYVAFAVQEGVSEPQIQVKDVTAGGTVTGIINVGGIVGEFATVTQILSTLTDAIVYDCVVSAEINKTDSSNERAGIIFGSVEGNTSANDEGKVQNAPFPDTDSNGDALEYSSRIVDKVFYSSYMTGFLELYGNSVVNSYQGKATTEGKFSAAEALSVYKSIVYTDDTQEEINEELSVIPTVYDVNNLLYTFRDGNEFIELDFSFIESVSAEGDDEIDTYYQYFDGSVYNFSDEFIDIIEANDGSGDAYGFSISGKEFTLEEDGIQSSDTEVFKVILNEKYLEGSDSENRRKYYIDCFSFASADLVFTYTNGLKIGIPVDVGVSVDGSGTLENPYKVPDAKTLARIVPIMASRKVAYFIQTADIDMADYEGTVRYLKNFDDIYDGSGYSITGYNVTATDTTAPAGIFGKLTSGTTDEGEEVAGEVKNLTLINCTVNGGATAAGTGVVAGEVSNGATISNVTLEGCTATADKGPVGGAVGILGASTLEQVTVKEDTKVTATSGGSAGGVVGEMQSSSSKLIAPVVENVTVSSGATYDSEGNFAGSSAYEDIAGGIVAQALGTITGITTEVPNADGTTEKTVEYAQVNGVTVNALISGGAVGAVYNPDTMPDGSTSNILNLENIRVTSTTVNAQTTNTAAKSTSGAGLLGRARGNNAIELNDCQADATSTVNSITNMNAYGAGAVAEVEAGVQSIKFIDVEAYAEVNSTSSSTSGQAYAASLVANVNIDPNFVSFDGCVAGGKITADAVNTYTAGVIGGFVANTTAVTGTNAYFVNGIISASLTSANSTKQDKVTDKKGRFIAGYTDGMFSAEAFKTMFVNNYYSSYPDATTPFFADNSDLDTEITWSETVDGVESFGFKDVGTNGRLELCLDASSWSSVAIVPKSDLEIPLYAQIDEEVGVIPYGSENNPRTSNASDNFYFVDNKVIEVSGTPEKDEANNWFVMTIRAKNYGATDLIAEYSCGLATRATVISIDIRGAGTEESPFLVGTPSELFVASCLPDRHYRQYQDIDLENSYDGSSDDIDKYINYNNDAFFKPIGTEAAPFTGSYDGQGFVIKGLKINRSGENNVGLFGKVTGTIKNVHLELMEADKENNKSNGIVGNTNVGGIAGNAEGATIENCSVVRSSVTGADYVGGIVGNFTDSKITNCFTQSDVNAFGTDNNIYAGGIVGFMNSATNASEVSGCFASGSIYATPASTLTGDSSYASGIVSYIQNATDLVIKNCLFTGTTASGYGILGRQSNEGTFGVTISNCIDAGQNVAMNTTADTFTKLTSPVGANIFGRTGITLGNVYYDNSLLITASDPSGVTGKATTELIATDMGEGWQTITGHYPVPEVSGGFTRYTYTLTENDDGELKPDVSSAADTEVSTDTYSQAYAKFLSAPVQVDQKEIDFVEEAKNSTTISYGTGLIYPVSLLTEIDGNEVTYASSIFDTTDTGEYPKNFDPDLYGIKTTVTTTEEVEDEEGNVTTKEVTEVVVNKNTDLLFGLDSSDKTKTIVYRNIFDNTKEVTEREGLEKQATKNTFIKDDALTGSVFSNGEAYYNAQVPVIYASATIGSVTVYREIKVPMNYGETYCISTQRQLFALGGNDADPAYGDNADKNHKFYGYYGSDYDYKLLADIDCANLLDDNGDPIIFKPIAGRSTAEYYSGDFDGCGNKISNLVITGEGSDVGFFARIKKGTGADTPSVKNLTLENVEVSGKANVGALVGRTELGSIDIENCKVIGDVIYGTNDQGETVVTGYKGSVTGTSNVGGLIGKSEYTYSDGNNNPPTITSCSSTIMVTGTQDAVGGLIGESAAVIDSCYAIGNVICEKLPGGEDAVYGVGGLIGIMTNGSATKSFASGNVEVKRFRDRADQALVSGEIGIGGFVGYITEMVSYSTTGDKTAIDTEIISTCFSGGNVKFGTDYDNLANIKANEDILFGIGGFSGINREKIKQVYSSAAVKSEFGTITDNTGTHGIGVGGVAGIAFDKVDEVYSSGSVSESYIDYSEIDGSYYNYGGTIGYDVNESSAHCYYDSWTNNDPNLTSIGNRDNDDSNKIKAYTTNALTSGTRPETGTFQGGVWGFTQNAYPYLTELLKEGVDPYIKTNAILSVVCVNVENDDISAKTNRGVSQALIVPSTFTYKDSDGKTYAYQLKWSGATLNENRAAINRTKNIDETVVVEAYVDTYTVNDEKQYDNKGNEISYQQYASRDYERLCADMLGTFDQPYLIGNATDLGYINMDADTFKTAQADYPEFYGQWATPINRNGAPIDENGNTITANTENVKSGIVHYQLSSNIDAKDFTTGIPDAAKEYTFTTETTTTTDEGETVTTTIPKYTITYKGFMLKGNNYAVQNVTSAGCFFNNVNSDSTITNIIFDNFTFTGSDSGSALINENNGTLQDVYVRGSFSGGNNVAGLVLTNNSTIDGCVVDAEITNATENVGVMAVTNNGTIINSATAGTLKTGTGTVTNIGAFVVDNNGTISKSFSMADIDVDDTTAVTYVSGFVVNNAGTIDGVYTRSGISFKAEPEDTNTIASLVSNITNETNKEPVTNSYAAAYLGYFNSAQDSILFGTVPDTMNKLSSVFVDKSLAGTPSKDSYKYSESLSSIMSLEYRENMKYEETNKPDGLFTANADNNVLPQHTSIIKAENNEVVDEDGNILYIDISTGDIYTLEIVEHTQEDGTKINVERFVAEDGTEYLPGTNNESIMTEKLDENGEVVRDEEGYVVYEEKVTAENLSTVYDYYLGKATLIRNYDVLKAYSEISIMAIKTGQSQYIDRLALKSDTELKSTLSTSSNATYSHSGKIVGTSGTVMSATAVGEETVIAKYTSDKELLRGIKINPNLCIDVKVVNETIVNPNFSGGIGTESSPYVISDAASLASLHYYGTESDLYFILGADIDMSPDAEENKGKGYEDFQIHHFKAKLNAPESTGGSTAQYTIRNFISGSVNEDGTLTAGHGGLFGKIESDAVVNNVALTGKIIGSEQYTGALANIIEGNVTNCVVAADVKSTFNATENAGSGTGVLAGRATNGAVVSNIVTTGTATTTDIAESTEEAPKATNVVGGVIGSAQNATMTNFLSTAVVKTENARVLAGGIIGEMLEGTSLKKVLFGGFADGYAVDPNAETKVYNAYPIVASKSDSATVENAYYDSQMNNRTFATTVVGEATKTKACEALTIFDSTNTIDAGYYPVPIALGTVENSTFKATASLAAVTMNFYLGASTGEKGLYTIMQFNDKASNEKIVADSEKYTTDANEEKVYFGISEEGYDVVTNVYNPSKDPVLTLSLESNGAVRKVYPGLANNANITYTIEVDEKSGFSKDAEKLLGVLLKSVSNNNVNVLNDFTSKIGTEQTGLTLVIAQGMDSFYVGDMLPAGYEYKVTYKVNDGSVVEATSDNDIYGAKVDISDVKGDKNGNIETNVNLILTIVEKDKPWGVNSIFNTLWHTNTLN